MHRTTADGHVIENGKRRFEDQDLPLKPGTADTAGYNNAVQEELANIVELTGGTLATDEIADRAGGWRQVYDAIFKGGNIGVDAIGTLNGTVTWDSGVAKTEVACGGVELHSGENWCVASNYQVSVRQQAVPAPVAAQTAITKKGIAFHGTAHVSQTATPYAWASFALPAGLRHLGIPPKDSAGNNIGFSFSRSDPQDPLVAIPVSATLPVLSAGVRYTDLVSGLVCTQPCALRLSASGAQYTCADVDVICDVSTAPSPDFTSSITITIMYDASALP